MANTNDLKDIKFMPRNINFINIVITLEDIEKIKLKKRMTTKRSEEYFFPEGLRKRQQTLKWFPYFDWLLTSYDHLTLTSHLFISHGQNTFYSAKSPL